MRRTLDKGSSAPQEGGVEQGETGGIEDRQKGVFPAIEGAVSLTSFVAS